MPFNPRRIGYIRQFLKHNQPDFLFLIRRHWKTHGSFPNILRPETFNEKILYRMLFDRRDILKTFSDKYEERRYVQRVMGTDAILPDLYGVVDDDSDLRSIEFPPRFVMKPAHASQRVSIYDGQKKADLQSISKTIKEWLTLDYYELSRQWQFKGLKRRVIIEEYMVVGSESPPDFRFFCFDGRVGLVQAVFGRFSKHREQHYDRNGTPLHFSWGYPLCERAVPAPKHFYRMIETAERLSAGMDFLRVDLYHLEDRIKFGEMGLCPSAGLDKFEPASWDAELGRMWDLRVQDAPLHGPR